MNSRDLFEIGTVANTHGIHGDIKIIPWTDDPEVFNTFPYIYIKAKEGLTRYNVLRAKFHKGTVLLSLENIDNITLAEELKGQAVYIERTALPAPGDNSYFIKDLIGLSVYTEGDAPFGEIKDVFQTGSNDVYVVRTTDGKDVLIPAIKSVVKEINIDKSYVKIELIEGLI